MSWARWEGEWLTQGWSLSQHLDTKSRLTQHYFSATFNQKKPKVSHWINLIVYLIWQWNRAFTPSIYKTSQKPKEACFFGTAVLWDLKGANWRGWLRLRILNGHYHHFFFARSYLHELSVKWNKVGELFQLVLPISAQWWPCSMWFKE